MIRRSTRKERAAAATQERARRHALAREIADRHDGVSTRVLLREAGLTRGQVQGEIDRGVWVPAGCHTLCITTAAPTGRGLWWRALWESGSRSVLDGPSALLAAGLTGWSEQTVHISVPNGARPRRIEGVTHHQLQDLGDLVPVGLRRTKPEVAAIRAAHWATSDRQAATVIAMAVQQRLVLPSRLLANWEGIRYSPRRALLECVIQDVCNGAHSLNELDFARECRRRGLPVPTRQAVRTGKNGRVYLDVFWEAHGVHVEIQGAQHFEGTAGIDDALRFNDLGLRDPGLRSLQVPVLGLRTCPDKFFEQIEQLLAA